MKRAKKILLWTGIGAGTLIVILLIAAACYVWIIGSRLEKRLAALKAAGEPICLADLARKPIPPEQNGATYLQQAQNDLNAVDKIITTIEWDEELNYKPDGLSKVLETINAYPNVYPLLERAAACPDFDSQPDFSLPPSKFTGKPLEGIVNRSSARFLDARIQGLLLKGRSDEAMQAAILMMKISRQFEKEPLLIKNLIAKAMEDWALHRVNSILQVGTINNQSRADLDKELSLHGSMEIVRHALKTERAFSLDCFNHEFPWSLFSYHWQLGVLNVYEEYLNYSLQPYSNWANKDDLKGAIPNKTFNTFADLLRPGLRRALIAPYRIQTYVRTLRIINALQKKVPSDSDVVPSMEELGLPADVGIDPFNGKPLIIKKLPEGWLVYSVGENLQDDGGKFENRLDVGFGPKISATEEKQKKPPQ